jgi:imidazoleglycerol-phosphate dehydratase
VRKAERERNTKETRIKAVVDIDGTGLIDVDTRIPFFDHMLQLMGRHALFDMELKAEGDIEVDAHHTVEDTGLVLGGALDAALGDRQGITRFASSLVPMDECLAEVAIDLSGRPYLSYDVDLEPDAVGVFDPALARDFFQSVVNASSMTMHVTLRKGRGVHHGLEAVFKSAGRALKDAVSIDPRVTDIPSTKGTL